MPGVRVGHATVWHDEPHVARTGVTMIVPDAPETLFDEPMAAGTAVLNGAGELTNSITVREWGAIESPIAWTNTMGVGRAYEALVQAMIGANPRVGVDDVIIPTVGECDDSFLNDSRVSSPSVEHALAALTAASGDAVVEGVVGAGTGMTCLGYKGGIGSSSRVVDDFTIGVMVLSNFGDHDRLTIDGVPVGRLLGTAPAAAGAPDGSCMVCIATDAPLSPAQCERVARRAGLGLARTGSTARHWSGEIFLAFSTTNRMARDTTETVLTRPELAHRVLNVVFEAAVDATEEAVLNSLFVADAVVGVNGNRADGLPHERVLAILRAHGHRV